MKDFFNRNLNFLENFGSQNLKHDSIKARVTISVKCALFIISWVGKQVLLGLQIL